jgi:hypothetical protein
MGDGADEGVDAVAGDKGRDRREGADQLDGGGVESDLLLGLAQRGRREVGIVGILAATGEGDLAGVAPQVGAALGEDQPGLLGPAVERQEDRGVGAAAGLDQRRFRWRQQPLRQPGGAQTITWTVPPSTDQAAPAT